MIKQEHLQLPRIPPTKQHRHRLRALLQPLHDVELALDRPRREPLGELRARGGELLGVVEDDEALELRAHGDEGEVVLERARFVV